MKLRSNAILKISIISCLGKQNKPNQNQNPKQTASSVSGKPAVLARRINQTVGDKNYYRFTV